MLQRLITPSFFLILLLVVSIFAAGIAEANNPPTTTWSFDDLAIIVGETLKVPLDDYFSDPDGDTLTYSVKSGTPVVVSVSLSDTTLTCTGVSNGFSTITMTASDPDGESVSADFDLVVLKPIITPAVKTQIPDQTVQFGKVTVVDLADAFNGDPLFYEVSSVGSTVDTENIVSLYGVVDGTKTLVANAEVLQNTVNLYGVAEGTTTITVTAKNSLKGLSSTAEQSFTLTVTPPIANERPTTTWSIDNLGIIADETLKLVLDDFFSDPDGDTLTYSVKSTTPAVAAVSVSGPILTLTGVSTGFTKITLTASDPDGASVSVGFTLTVPQPGIIPPSVRTQISDQTVRVGAVTVVDLADAFSGNPLFYEVSSSDSEVGTENIVFVYGVVDGTRTLLAEAEVLGNRVPLYGVAEGTTTITVTAKNSLTEVSASAKQSFSLTVTAPTADSTASAPDTADAVPGLSGQEVSQLAALLRYDTVVFNELHNSSGDTNDWLELRNVSGTALSLNGWQLTIRTGSGSVVIPFPTDTVIPAGEVVLLVNTEIATTDTPTASVVAETFVLPQADFALVLRSPTTFGDIAGNYFQTEGERPETAPALTVDTVWYRTEPFVFGYRAEAWVESTYQDGLGTPGSRHPSSAADLNNDGIVNILDLVLVASQFGMTGETAADLNSDNTVNIQDLVLVANALGDIAGAPAAEQSTAGLVNSWLRLARQNASSIVETSLPEGFSYERGILALEQLARALMPEKTALLPNYPNPFNPETWIPYQLAKAAEVTVTIYTSEGSVVRTLALGHQDAGMYKSRSQAAYWDGKNTFGEKVASGLYFYTLTAGEFTATRKMLILK